MHQIVCIKIIKVKIDLIIENLKFEWIKNISKILVIGIIGLGVIVSLLVNNFLVGAKGTQSEMNEIDCYSLAETSFEFQGNVIKVSEEQTCKLIKMITEMKPVNENYSSEKDDPWHYYGRLRIRPKNSVWFLIFIAKKSKNYKPIFPYNEDVALAGGL